ncbi:MAG: putative metalloprotease CJM1_0395 family protein [Verrucomicrobiota bacterium]|nr:putative metalloprotease CJM1_0395 family protein [Verrucomicrobiota bacterium]
MPSGNSAFGRNPADADTRDTRNVGAATPSGTRKVLSTDESKEVSRLQKRDADVRAHEQAHISAGGGLVRGGASYKYQQGPDGKSYAVGGEVQIELSSGKTPSETAAKARQARSAALAPANPSAQDKAVAAKAAQLEQKALSQQTEEALSTDGSQAAATATSAQALVKEKPSGVSNDRELNRVSDERRPQAIDPRQAPEKRKPLSSDPILDRLLREARGESAERVELPPPPPESIARTDEKQANQRVDDSIAQSKDEFALQDASKAAEKARLEEEARAAARLQEAARSRIDDAAKRSEEARRRFLEDPIISWLLGEKSREATPVEEPKVSRYDAAIAGFKKPVDPTAAGRLFKADA